MASDSRALTCTRCAETVHVTELPAEFIDPERYVCGECLREVPDQLDLLREPRHGRQETKRLRDHLEQAAIPY